MNKYLTEFIGTFFLVLTVGCTVIPGRPGVLAPLAIGASLMVMIFAGGHISGAHYNPAVTLAVWIRGRCPTADVPGYIIAQVLAAAIAGSLVLFMKGHPSVTALEFKTGIIVPLLAEVSGTLALAYLMLS